MGMTSDQLDHLDGIAREITGTTERGRYGPLSTGEKLYVALAANRADLLASHDYTIVEALWRLGSDDVVALMRRWQFR
jgi:hypothetical protein